jgi:dimethylhistidine N-methyltransferase
MTVLERSLLRRRAKRDTASVFASDVVAGLGATPKRLPAKYFYDKAGSQLFEQITALPEYYPTRTELTILEAKAAEIAALVPPGAGLIEFGSGSTVKARILLRAAPKVFAYAPVDISAEFLDDEASRLRADCPDIAVLPIAADFTRPFDLPGVLEKRPRVGFFPGSTIGNFEPLEAVAFLRNAARILGPAATLIVGVDLVKDKKVLYDAYNDTAGVTARFNLNLLARINRELGADFDPSAFEHHAIYHGDLRRIEMHLASRKAQKVRVCGRCFEFRAGETIHTENSYKYTVDGFAALARGAGWTNRAAWTDAREYFSVHALTIDGAARP